MASTRLERKGRKNKTVAKARVAAIKRLSLAPVIKNVDIEALKAEFNKPKAKKIEVIEPVAEVAVVAEAPVEEKKVAAKKSAAKKKE